MYLQVLYWEKRERKKEKLRFGRVEKTWSKLLKRRTFRKVWLVGSH